MGKLLVRCDCHFQSVMAVLQLQLATQSRIVPGRIEVVQQVLLFRIARWEFLLPPGVDVNMAGTAGK